MSAGLIHGLNRYKPAGGFYLPSLLGRRFKFRPIDVETSGSLGQSTLSFLKELGGRIARETGHKREAEFIFQRISLAVVRGNATSLLMGSTPG